jgi:hypothetical protein
MKKTIAGFFLLGLGVVGMAWVYSLRPLSDQQLVTMVMQNGSFGRNSFASPFYQVYLMLTGLCSLSGGVLIFFGWSRRKTSTL